MPRTRLVVNAVAILLLLFAGTPAGAQSLLDRPPNLSGGWVGNKGTVYFNFLHRFTASSGSDRKVFNFPTFTIATGLPARLMLGANYATNSQLAPNYPNEWEFFARHALLRQDDGAPLDVGGQVGYNLAAEGVDGEVSLGRRLGPVRVIGAARIMSDPFEAGHTRFALAGGGTIRLNRFFALAGDVASLMNREEGEKVAWSAGLHLALPYTPHTLSLQAANTNANTLQGASRGEDKVRYGFEFTVPLTLARWFGPKQEPVAAVEPPPEPETPTEAAPATPLTPVNPSPAPVPADTATPAPSPAPANPPPAPADTGLARPPAKPAAQPATPAAKPAAKPAPRVVKARIQNLAYAPARIEVTAGSTIEWTNRDQLPHTVTANDKSFDSGMIQPGATWRRTFSRPGTYAFFCQPHPFMKGVVVVK